jgi:hypothetical protein
MRKVNTLRGARAIHDGHAEKYRATRAAAALVLKGRVAPRRTLAQRAGAGPGEAVFGTAARDAGGTGLGRAAAGRGGIGCRAA